MLVHLRNHVFAITMKIFEKNSYKQVMMPSFKS